MIRTSSLDPQIAAKFAALDKNRVEILVHRLYHIKTISGNVDGSVNIPTELDFFQTKVGQTETVGATSTSLTYEDTNMESNGAVGTPYKFWGQYLTVLPLAAKDAAQPVMKSFDKTAINKEISNDWGRILQRGVVEISVLGQPLARFSPIQQIPTDSAVGSSATFGFDTNMSSPVVTTSVADAKNQAPIDLWLEDTMNFDFRVKFPAGAFALYNSIRLGFVLHGLLIRPRIQG